jgi:hypothetical protein
MDVVRSSPPLGSGGYKKRWLQEAVATRSGGYKRKGCKRKGCKKEARDRPEKKRPGRWSWPLENFRRYFDPNH